MSTSFSASAMLAERFMNPLQRLDFTMNLFYPKLLDKLNDAVKNMHDFTNSVITERRELLQKPLPMEEMPTLPS